MLQRCLATAGCAWLLFLGWSKPCGAGNLGGKTVVCNFHKLNWEVSSALMEQQPHPGPCWDRELGRPGSCCGGLGVTPGDSWSWCLMWDDEAEAVWHQLGLEPGWRCPAGLLWELLSPS